MIVLRLLQWERTTKAFRSKPTSISKGFEYLTKGKIDGFSSAGNTGAMFVGSLYSKSNPGILRPPLAALIPREDEELSIMT